MTRSADPFTGLGLPPTPWQFSLDAAVPGEDLVAVGGDLAPGTVLHAYARGLFPMGLGEGGQPPLGWWSPDPRGCFRAGDFHASRSLLRSERRFTATVDAAFEDVLAGCADPSRPHGWITEDIRRTYTELHRRGWAHSVEVWCDGALAGGLYGVAIGGLFAAESKFHRVTDASKAAVDALTSWWFDDAAGAERLVDVQWSTEHLARLGAREVSRTSYLDHLHRALRVPGARVPTTGVATWPTVDEG